MTPAPPLVDRLPRGLSARAAMLFGGFGVAALLAWSAATRVDVVVVAPAAARPSVAVAELRAPASAVVEAVAASVGARVARGELLLRFSAEDIDAGWRASSRALAIRRRTLRDHEAVLAWLQGDLHLAAVAGEAARVRIRGYRTRLAQLDASVGALAAELEGTRARAGAARELLALTGQRYEALTAAFRKGAVSRFMWLQARRELLDEERVSAASASAAAALGDRLETGRAARRQAPLDLREKLLREIGDGEVAVAELRGHLAELSAQRRLRRLVAPLGGVLDRLEVTRGDFVERGERLGAVVPEPADVVFETRVATRQAAFVAAGQPCRLKLDALPFARYGALPCVVESVGRDVVAEGANVHYYVARVRPLQQALKVDGRHLTLRPGATARVDLIAGRRTVLSFVTEPLTRFARESLREP